MSDSVKSDKVCVVVGVGEGLGMALAMRFAAGYKVALIARSPEVIGKTASEIKAGGGIALPIQSDATVEAGIAAAHERIKRELGPVDILIFNGGRRPMGRLMDTTPQVFEETWRLHTFGAFLWARELVPEMLSRRSGAILITGATAGRQAVADLSGIRAGKVCGARARRGDVARLTSPRHPRRIRERRWRNRYAVAQKVSA